MYEICILMHAIYVCDIYIDGCHAMYVWDMYVDACYICMRCIYRWMACNLYMRYIYYECILAYNVCMRYVCCKMANVQSETLIFKLAQKSSN